MQTPLALRRRRCLRHCRLVHAEALQGWGTCVFLFRGHLCLQGHWFFLGEGGRLVGNFGGRQGGLLEDLLAQRGGWESSVRKSEVCAGLRDSLCWGLGLELVLLSTFSW